MKRLSRIGSRYLRMFVPLFLMLLLIGGVPSLAASPQMIQTLSQPEQVKVSVNQTLSMTFAAPIKRAVVADEKVASISVISPTLMTITGRTFGFTQLLLWDENDRQMLYDVRVDVDTARLLAVIKEVAPTANITVNTLLDTIILSGTVADAPTAERIVDLSSIFSPKVQNQLKIAGSKQVLLRATVAEVSREAVRALGLNGTFFGTRAFGGSNLNMINPSSIGLQDRRLVPIESPNQFQIIGGDLSVLPSTTLYFGLPSAQMELFLQAMQENSLMRILAEPNLVAISGQEAEFLAGGELPIPVPSQDGIAITYREYGVRLKFLPVVQEGEIIRISVTSEVSEPNYTNAVQISGYVVPGINTRRAQTVVELGSGQTFAIAGLLSENLRGIAHKVPGVGSIPVLGPLFRSMRYERAETELIILITPELAAPLNPNQVDYLPGLEMSAPNDWELYGLGLIEGQISDSRIPTSQPTQPRYNPPGALCGPWGPQQTAISLDQ